MPDKAKEEKKVEEKPQGVSRREFLVGAGTGVAGLVVGGAVGYKVIPQPVVPSTPLPELWIGRNIASQSCMGCRLCQTACSQIKEQKIQPAIARVQVPQYYPGVEFPVLCYQCGDEAKCIEACPVQALSLDTSKKLNTIKVDTTKCLRTAKNGDCTLCQDKCPGTAVTFHPTTRAPLICDLCGGDPACVKACYSQTLTLKGVKMAAVKPEEIAASLADQYKVPPPPKAALPGNLVATANDDLFS
jgi:carbon-monoxide dehydrogenase iron sulfur subunit